MLSEDVAVESTRSWRPSRREESLSSKERWRLVYPKVSMYSGGVTIGWPNANRSTATPGPLRHRSRTPGFQSRVTVFAIRRPQHLRESSRGQCPSVMLPRNTVTKHHCWVPFRLHYSLRRNAALQPHLKWSLLRPCIRPTYVHPGHSFQAYQRLSKYPFISSDHRDHSLSGCQPSIRWEVVC